MYLFLLVLIVFFNLILNTIYKYNRFFEFLPKKTLKFSLYNRKNLVSFNSYLVLLPIKIYFIIDKQNYKKYIFMAYNINCLEIVIALLIKIVIFYIQIFII